MSAQVHQRAIRKIVPAVRSGPISRLIGTVDVDGNGTHHDELPEVDPFILLDQATIPANGKPPFGAHPHRGHSVVTVLTKGRVKSWDSFSRDHTTISAPAAYWVDAGSGVFHDETSVVEDESDPNQHVSLLQLWVGVHEEDRRKHARMQYDTNLPVEDAVDPDGNVVGRVTHFVGRGGIETPHPIAVAHVHQEAGTTFHFPIGRAYGGFIVNCNGGDMFVGCSKGAPATFGGMTPENTNDVLVLADRSDTAAADGDENAAAHHHDVIDITTAPDSSADYIVCTGESHKESWAKKLVANGAVIAATPEEARTIAAQVEKYAAAGMGEGGSFAPFGK